MPAIWTPRNNPVTVEDAGANIIFLFEILSFWNNRYCAQNT